MRKAMTLNREGISDGEAGNYAEAPSGLSPLLNSRSSNYQAANANSAPAKIPLRSAKTRNG
jgi:hypothetical protein